MPDRRKHRGPHPADRELFAARHLERLRAATADLSWLLERSYTVTAALDLVGDRHSLTARQRLAVRRCACGDTTAAARVARRIQIEQVDPSIVIDGFNVLITVESALSGGGVLIGRDGAYRDLAGVHGSYRRVSETERAIDLVAQTLSLHGVERAVWLLDRPVSNSGRLGRAILERSEASRLQMEVEVELHDDPDRVLIERGEAIATSDSAVLDRSDRSIDLPAAVIAADVKDAWLLDLR